MPRGARELLSTLLCAAVVSACSGEAADIMPAADPPDTGALPAPPVDASEPPPPPPDAGFPEDTGPPPPPPDAGPPPDAEPRMECPCIFVEEFADPNTIETTATTAMIDFAGAGSASTAADRTLRPPGNGAAGALEVTSDQTLPAGEHDFTSLTVRGAELEFAGDTTIRVTGAVELSGDAQLTVLGKLTLIVGGNITLDCSNLATVGDLEIEQSNGNLAAGCALGVGRSDILTDYRSIGSSGRILVSTRGTFSLSNGARLYTGSVADPAGRSGDIEIRTYGGVQVGPGSGLIVTGGTNGANGDLTILTEGAIVADGSRLAGGASAAATSSGGTIRLRARGPITVRNGGNLLSSPGGSIEVVTESALAIENSSYVVTDELGTQAQGNRILLRSASLAIGSSQFPGDPSAVVALAGLTVSSTLTIEAVGAIDILEQATVGTPEVSCIAGGDVKISAEGNVNVSAGALIAAGTSKAGPPCTAKRGGSLTIHAAGTVASPETSTRVGLGSPNGVLDVRGTQPVRLGVLAAELATLRQVTSRPLDIMGTPTMPSATAVATGTSTPPSYAGLHVRLSRDGTEYLPSRYLPIPIQSGWRYHLLIEPRMFDAVTLDSFSVSYR